MRRGRGKGKKQNASAREDRGSGDEEKIPAYRRRGRPQKPMKDDFEEEEEEDDEEMVEKMEVEDEDEEIDDGSVTSKDLKKERKRKMSNGSNTDLTEEENGLGSKPNTDDSTRSTSIGFRQNGSRRKSKPRRAAEAVVECNGV
ncbi:hypothetical protein AtNW77_Chr2g0264481 [Arabidopsis thaliana]|uniref:Uncharacterized protein n=4 Tax=Arabidopsis TaxID=3701 RepID=A0A178VYK0_ARATH|nr:unknown [Arabidopsis thaliana]KAG7639416.1 hypothetical protein ISN45_At02g037380 [Arabidopsis thaliana x Arabidopsis arenosa]KAG7644003.1 hypothetical protein ISN44_As02g037480 [Arabidopsis suecica]KAG7639417.1 hypothetical protein ISN45_At02g037380 [Arabidopsis thaliana x Arabidopsis arenosa]KAG7644004.1 hypothetical protein ISN44_As02g037480 [Arabidopsis suecica]